MRSRIVGMLVIVTGVLLAAGVALGQTAGPTLRPSSPSIVPVTGPSTGPGLPEAAKPELIPASAQAPSGKGEGIRADEAAPATATGPAPRAVKVVHKPGAKAAVKKASAPNQVTKAAARPAKAKHVATTKRQVPAKHTALGQPTRVPTRQPPTKGVRPAPPVLPRV